MSRELEKPQFSVEIQKIIKNGVDGYKKYVLENFKEEFKGLKVNDEIFACWYGGAYICSIYGLDHGDKMEYPNEVKELKELYNWKGVYHCSMENKTESHFFTLEVDDNNITLIQTYGGIKRVTVQIFDKNKWIENLLLANDGDFNSYRYIFNIPLNENTKSFNTKETKISFYKMP